jgi:hypothetical protein
VNDFWRSLSREAASLWDMITVFLVSVFDPQAGWQPKAIFGSILLLIVFWISKRGTKS